MSPYSAQGKVNENVVPAPSALRFEVPPVRIDDVPNDVEAKPESPPIPGPRLPGSVEDRLQSIRGIPEPPPSLRCSFGLENRGRFRWPSRQRHEQINCLRTDAWLPDQRPTCVQFEVPPDTRIHMSSGRPQPAVASARNTASPASYLTIPGNAALPRLQRDPIDPALVAEAHLLTKSIPGAGRATPERLRGPPHAT
jgi:hypothetical protein